MSKARVKQTPEELDRMADLHLAYQFGQDYVTESNPNAVKEDFESRFKNDTAALKEFDKGAANMRARISAMKK